ncbi:hypothetical protein ACUXST_001006 [Sphingomonas sp. F9_3S_D5_B_2]
MSYATRGHAIVHFGEQGMLSWYKAKMFIEHASVISSDALHVLAGVGLWLVAAMLLRRRLTDWLPLIVVLAAILFNEAVDLWMEQWPNAAEQYGESAKDLLLTMVVPAVLMLAARTRPELFAMSASGSRRGAGGRPRRP